jgi:phospholipase D1/2
MNSPLPLEAKLSLYNNTVTSDTGQYFCNSRPFSMPRTGNKVSILSSGQVVLRNIYQALMSAEHFIWIADWQMAFDVELVRRGGNDHPGQLHKVIEQIIKTKPVQVRVLLFRSVKDTVPGTYDGMVADKLNGLNKKGYPGSVKVALQAPTTSQLDSIDYSHHQKFVVVDGRVGFIGGIDLSYGRWETPEFDVVADPARQLINEMYSPGMRKLRPPSKKEKQIIAEFDCAGPYGGTLIEEGCQPRMPWQDVHIKIEGPSVVDIHRNFVRRWNAMHTQPGASYPIRGGELLNKEWLEKVGGWQVLQEQQQLKGGGAQVQIVRSVSNRHLAVEGGRPEDLLLYAHTRERDTWQQCLNSWYGEHQNNILNAMVNCIRSADNYVYIETQFFISSFGTWGTKTLPIDDDHSVVVPVVDSARVGNENNGIKNTIVDALAARIIDHIKAKTPFHVYMVVPVHPEGDLADGSVWKQHWLALTTIKHGSNSLINRIKRGLKEKKRNPDEWVQYLTVLNMRSHGATVQYARDPNTFDEDFSHEIGRFVVTEQIYIHSKLLIVDDAVAIVGSANINDRSLTGNGDTEIAAVVVDTEGVELRDLGSPTMTVQTRKFARELRRQLWEKHFGFLIDSTSAKDTAYFNSAVRAQRATGKMDDSVEHPPRLKTTKERVFDISKMTWQNILDKPCAPEVVKAVQMIAAHNAKIYEEVFQHTPRNTLKTFAACTSFFTLPYAALYDEMGTAYLRATVRPDANQPTFVRMTETQKADFFKRRDSFFQAHEDRAGKHKDYHGVIPPALQAQYMTTQLLPHQKAALNESTYGRLQQLYAGGKVHDVTKAIVYLKENVVGFFVAMPLDWGMGTVIDGDPTQHMSVDIASNDNPPNVKQGTQT